MALTNPVDLAGNDLVVNSISVGNATPGVVTNSTANIVTTNTTQTITGNKTLNAVTWSATGSQKSNASAVTCSSNAATTTTPYTKITSESLTTAHTASQALTITYTGTATTDFAVATIIGGTNTQGVPVLKTACTSNTVTITIQNAAIATNAFNGTFIIWLQVFKS